MPPPSVMKTFCVGQHGLSVNMHIMSSYQPAFSSHGRMFGPSLQTRSCLKEGVL